MTNQFDFFEPQVSPLNGASVLNRIFEFLKKPDSLFGTAMVCAAVFSAPNIYANEVTHEVTSVQRSALTNDRVDEEKQIDRDEILTELAQHLKMINVLGERVEEGLLVSELALKEYLESLYVIERNKNNYNMAAQLLMSRTNFINSIENFREWRDVQNALSSDNFSVPEKFVTRSVDTPLSPIGIENIVDFSDWLT